MGSTTWTWMGIQMRGPACGVALLAASAFACGGAGTRTPAAATPAPTSTAPAAPAGELAGPSKATIAWKAMSKDERAQYMKDVVVPRMGGLFRAFDAKTFANFDCATCHGASAADRSYVMPNPALLTLPGNSAGFQSLMRDKPEWMRFMGRQVRPQMAALLGLDEVDMRNPKPDQFGCRNCHAMLEH
jgi:hypothetical protein